MSQDGMNGGSRRQRATRISMFSTAWNFSAIQGYIAWGKPPHVLSLGGAELQVRFQAGQAPPHMSSRCDSRRARHPLT